MLMFVMTGLFAGGDVQPSSAVQSEYAAKLTAAEPTSEAQFRLATWARKQGMNDVADGHLRAAVFIDPKNQLAQRALGRGEKAGVWESIDERKHRLAKETSLKADRVQWRKRLAEAGIEGAVKDHGIDEVGAAAVEEFAAQDSQRSLAAVEALGSSNHGAATMSLVRFAVKSKFPNVRKAAANALRERNPDDYLFPLIEFARPQRSGKTVVLGVGEIWYWQDGNAMFAALPSSAQPREPGTRNGARPVELETEMADRHAEAEVVRDNAVAAMQTATGLNIGNDFENWRQAVMQITHQSVESKPAQPTSLTTTNYQSDSLYVGTEIVPLRARFSCFAAGTLVATKRGDLPIDQVCVGELVLSRNVETGETAYKPVLARTLRARVPMNTLTVGGESLTVTPGHPIWSPEGGWVKAKDASSSVVFATEDKSIRVAGNEATEPAQAYNLVVADFGTYFVGKSRVLVHDNSPIRNPTPKRR